MKLIPRRKYLDELWSVKGSPDIKVITGIRRSGKSKLLEMFIDELRASEENVNAIVVDFNLLDFEPLAEYHVLHEYIEARHDPDASNYVFIDEVQMCEGFERAINSLHASGKYDIYITGSNAFLLGSDLATLFTGRTVSISVFPFSLGEFMEYYEIANPAQALERYVFEGGMPGSYVYQTERARYGYLTDVLDMLILRDIRQKHGVRNADALARVTRFLMDNVSNISSIKNIADELGRNGTRPSDVAVSSYVDYLCEAFAFYRVQRYDAKGKRYLSSGEKFYLADHSFRYAALGMRDMDYGRIYENMVAIELLRRGYEVFAGKLYEKEIDFVAMRQSEKMYIQVADNISAAETLERECASLLRIRDACPKLILANTHHDTYTHEGIEVHDLARWLAHAPTLRDA